MSTHHAAMFLAPAAPKAQAVSSLGDHLTSWLALPVLVAAVGAVIYGVTRNVQRRRVQRNGADPASQPTAPTGATYPALGGVAALSVPAALMGHHHGATVHKAAKEMGHAMSQIAHAGNGEAWLLFGLPLAFLIVMGIGKVLGSIFGTGSSN